MDVGRFAFADGFEIAMIWCFRGCFGFALTACLWIGCCSWCFGVRFAWLIVLV